MPRPRSEPSEPTRTGLPYGLTECEACRSHDLAWTASARVQPVDSLHPSPRVSVTATLHCNGCGVDCRIMPLHELLAALGSWVPSVLRPQPLPPLPIPPVPPLPPVQVAHAAPLREPVPT